MRRRSPLLRRHTCWMRLDTPAVASGGREFSDIYLFLQIRHHCTSLLVHWTPYFASPDTSALKGRTDVPWLSRELWAKLREWMTEAGFSDRAADIFCGKSLEHEGKIYRINIKRLHKGKKTHPRLIVRPFKSPLRPQTHRDQSQREGPET